MDITTAAVVLAAGEGKRMVSDIPQVLHKVAETPLVCHAVNMALGRGWSPLVVVVNPQNAGAVKEAISKSFPEAQVSYQVQQDSGGVLHAAEVGLEGLGSFEGNVLVLPGNMPLLQPDTTLLCLEAMIAEGSAGAQAPYVGLVQRGVFRHLPVFCAEKRWLQQALRAVNGHIGGDADSSAAVWIRDLQQALPDAAEESEGDVLAQFSARGFAVNAASDDDLCVVACRADQSAAEKLLRARLVAHHQSQGVTFRDPDNTFLGTNVTIGQDTTIGVGVQIYGSTAIGQRARIEGPTTILDSSIEDDVYIRSFSVLEGAHVSSGSGAGPFARLREGTQLGPSSYVGNFVETKNARIGRNTLACHLTYLGDADVGSRTNIGAGTITCNFDGVAKNATRIGDGAFVGSNSTLVAPVQVGDNAIIAAGSVVTEPVASGAVTFGRARQANKEDYAETMRARLKASHEQ